MSVRIDLPYYNLLSKVHDDKKVIKFLGEISPLIIHIYRGNLESEIQKYIVSNNKYLLTLENLEIIYGIDVINDYFYNSNYDYIVSSNNVNVMSYLNSQVENYIKTILLNPKVTCNREPQQNLEGFLKSDSISQETKEALIAKCPIVIDNIENFDKQLYPALLSHDRIQPSWNNVLCAFSQIDYIAVRNYILTHNLSGDFERSENEKDLAKELFSNLIREESPKVCDIYKSISIGYDAVYCSCSSIDLHLYSSISVSRAPPSETQLNSRSAVFSFVKSFFVSRSPPNAVAFEPTANILYICRWCFRNRESIGVLQSKAFLIITLRLFC